MSDPTPQQVDWYIKWYNALPIAEKCPPDKWGTRSICSCCGEPMEAKKNAAGEVFIDLQHKPDCKLHNEYLAFAKEHPDLSPGMMFLAWNHRND